MKYFLLPLLALSLLSDCRKESEVEPKTYTLSGRLLQDCQGSPIRNDTLLFEMSKWQWLYGTSATTNRVITDSQGYFSHTYKYQNDYTTATFKTKTGREIIDLKLNANYRLNDVLLNASSNFRIKFIFNQPYQIGDTLYMYNQFNMDSTIKIPAPFTDQIINHLFEVSRYYPPTSNQLKQITSSIRYSIYGNTTSDKTYHEEIIFYLKACSFDNQLVTLEIK